MMKILLLLGLMLLQASAKSSTPSNNPNREPKCIAVDSYHTHICTENPEASRRAVSSSFKDGADDTIMASAFDMNLGVEQRITGSETEQLRIRNVLRKMYTYFEEEVLSRSEYEHIRGRCKNEHELCAFWTSVKECETNRGFMLKNCPAACRLCLMANTNMMA